MEVVVSDNIFVVKLFDGSTFVGQMIPHSENSILVIEPRSILTYVDDDGKTRIKLDALIMSKVVINSSFVLKENAYVGIWKATEEFAKTYTITVARSKIPQAAENKQQNVVIADTSPKPKKKASKKKEEPNNVIFVDFKNRANNKVSGVTVYSGDGPSNEEVSDLLPEPA